MKNKTKKKKAPLKVTFHHIKPKNEAERQEQIKKVNGMFDILFNETMKTWKGGTNKELKKHFVNGQTPLE